MAIETQAVLFDHPESLPRIRWHEYARTATTDETSIIAWIMRLYNAGQAFDLDITYSTGRIWQNLPKPMCCMDLARHPGLHCIADVSELPIASNVARAVMFDPPFLADEAGHPEGSRIKTRFTTLHSMRDVYDLYSHGIRESRRILQVGGICTVKCQDAVHGGKQYMTHAHVIATAEAIGMNVLDLFVLIRKNPPFSPNMVRQVHARKTHSYYIVLAKARSKDQ